MQSQTSSSIDRISPRTSRGFSEKGEKQKNLLAKLRPGFLFPFLRSFVALLRHDLLRKSRAHDVISGLSAILVRNYGKKSLTESQENMSKATANQKVRRPVHRFLKQTA